jgi:hypothetical protein
VKGDGIKFLNKTEPKKSSAAPTLNKKSISFRTFSSLDPYGHVLFST